MSVTGTSTICWKPLLPYRFKLPAFLQFQQREIDSSLHRVSLRDRHGQHLFVETTNRRKFARFFILVVKGTPIVHAHCKPTARTLHVEEAVVLTRKHGFRGGVLVQDTRSFI